MIFKNANSFKTVSFSASDVLDIIFRDRMRSEILQASALNHEFHTPLTIIKGLAENLLRNPHHSPEENTRKIVNETDKLLKALDMLNTLIYSGNDGQIKKVSLRDLTIQSTSFFEKLCLEKGISIQVDIDEQIYVTTKPYKFKSMLGAIVQNAIESFSNIGHRGTKSVTFHASENEDGILLNISDTGVGMSDEDQTKIREENFTNFKKFEIANGLGLALAHYIAHDLRICLDFFSEKNRGTNVTIAFAK